MKKVILFVLALAMVVVAVAACAPKPTSTPVPPTPKPQVATPIPAPAAKPGVPMVDTTKYKKDPPWTIAYSNASTSNSWRIFTVAALYWAAEQYPNLIKEIVHVNANDSIPKQISDMEDLLVKGVDAIILAASSDSALNPAVDKAMAAGVPVIILERGINTENFVTFIDVDPKSIATELAEWGAKELGGKGKVVLYGVIPGITLSGWHEEATKAVLAKYPGMEMVAFDYGMVSRSKGKELMEAWLRKFPQIDGVLSWTGTDIQGGIEAAQEAGRLDQIKFWTGGDEQGWLQLIKKGTNGIGYASYADCTIDALMAAFKILRGEPVPKVWSLPVKLITPQNIDQYVLPDAPATWFSSRIPAAETGKWIDLASKK